LLFELQALLGDINPVLNLLRYQTFRAMAAFLTTFIFVLLVEPRFIAWLKQKGVAGQPIREDGPAQHFSKKGTPTMGGAVMIVGILLSCLLFCDLGNNLVIVTVLVLASTALLGFYDDWAKVTKQNSKGISGPQKLFWQFAIAGSAAFYLRSSGFSSELTIPFFKGLNFDLGILFVLFASIVIVGSSNAVNLTDGLDGLATGPIMTTAATYAVFAYLTGNIKAADYLGIPYVAGAGELSIILAAVVSAGLGFLWYNTFPAQVFMGDMGALGLGAILGISAVIVKQEIVLIIAGGVFVVEALSVIIQRYYYKATKKRVFRMAPIHHHFELAGLPEPKIIVRFWIVSIVLAILSLTSLKLR
jgi:phospho-N-acetylmuramoyl-pentapeptide-transferase